MKKLYLILTLSISITAFTQSQYCKPTFQYGSDGNMITQIIFGNINNTSPAQSGTTPIYEDFTGLSTDVQAGSVNSISIKGPSSTFPSDVVVFIDFNRNGSFDDLGESFHIGRLAAANPANAHTINGNIIIPSNITTGPTRMRILKNTNTAAYSDPNAPNSILSSCQNLRSGQAEDYTINIVGSNATFPAPYCGDEGITTLSVNEISQVEFAGITQNSTIDGNSPVIENFTGTVFNVNKENTYPISITGGTDEQSTVSVYAYIDFDHNNTFEPNETFNLGYLDNSNPISGTASGKLSSQITIPDTAMLGETRFRIVKAYESNSWMGVLQNLPCPRDWFIGQVEDYTINISPSALSTVETEKNNLKIYPNPTNGLVNIQTSDKIEKYEIYSLTGQKVAEGNNNTINLSDFPAGTYLVKIQFNNQKIVTQKIIRR
ncbi:T9SS type A sorting domain-containing protein [Chryseobacterium oryctis]|uniref:T9SS type A sorting domain-containing protein n=1 Tax=Chryseobacterium oryctis TaxID=2952618 RepID=A0ABT3HRE7_9FLAO|nr:T9SS type A sorting domain-containing protein [Chryseobacterium oryctis]MCW3162250.1 T9SS type A sorting domain-containing protein [Chryseobacterium oryctis]